MSTITLVMYSSTITLLRTRVLKKYSYSSTITPSLVVTISYFHHDIQRYDYRVTNGAVLVIWFITFIN